MAPTQNKIFKKKNRLKKFSAVNLFPYPTPNPLPGLLLALVHRSKLEETEINDENGSHLIGKNFP